MSKVLDEVLAANAKYVQSFGDKGKLPLPPARRFAILTCIGLALWAMTVAPIAVVAALRETSILFATLIAGFVLRESIGALRVLSACIIAGGAAILRLA